MRASSHWRTFRLHHSDTCVVLARSEVRHIAHLEREVEKSAKLRRNAAADEASDREARRWRGGSGPSKRQRTFEEATAEFEARRTKDAIRNARRDAKLRAASAARVRDNKPATVAEALKCWGNAHERVLNLETGWQAAGGRLAVELLDLVHDALAQPPDC